ncbi:MAG: dephospho-CoA kinase [Peptococcaceae bacterium]|nr:MAG: dephospho-CoA kinase [Peptococcaceae bacterium]
MIIGLTGNIGSGKSTVAHYLKKLGAKVIDADQVARAVVAPGQPALAEIVEHFGPAVLNPDGTLNRSKMGSIVFADPSARAKLNSITHPRIGSAIRREIERLRPDTQVLVLEAPLLIEAGLRQAVDEIWVVKINEAEQLKRVRERDDLTVEEAVARLNAQLPQEEKLKYADRIIDNSGAPEETEKQVKCYWKALLKKAGAQTSAK